MVAAVGGGGLLHRAVGVAGRAPSGLRSARQLGRGVTACARAVERSEPWRWSSRRSPIRSAGASRDSAAAREGARAAEAASRARGEARAASKPSARRRREKRLAAQGRRGAGGADAAAAADTPDNPLAVTQKSADPTVAGAGESALHRRRELARRRGDRRACAQHAPRRSRADDRRRARARKGRDRGRRARESEVADCRRSRAATSGLRTRKRPSRSRSNRRSHRRASAKPKRWRSAAPGRPRPRRSRAAEEASGANQDRRRAGDHGGARRRRQFTIRKQDGRAQRGRREQHAAAAGLRRARGKCRYAREQGHGRQPAREVLAVRGDVRRGRAAASSARPTSSSARSTGRGRRAASRSGASSAQRSRTSSPTCSPGEQTALNTAASPFADVPGGRAPAHPPRVRASGSLRSLPLAGGPFDDPQPARRARDRDQRRRQRASGRRRADERLFAVRLRRVQRGDARGAVCRAAAQDPVGRRPRLRALGLLSQRAPVRHVQRAAVHPAASRAARRRRPGADADDEPGEQPPASGTRPRVRRSTTRATASSAGRTASARPAIDDRR